MTLNDFFSKPIEECFDEASGATKAMAGKKVKGLIVPHAGYIYSGTVAAAGYKLLKENDYNKVIILGFYHEFDRNQEHSVKIQIPFIKHILGKVEIEEKYCEEGPINLEAGEKTLVVASSDLSHYLPENEARKIDKKTIEAIVSMEEKRIVNEAEACGIMPILTINKIANIKKWKCELVDYKTSGEVTGDLEAVVGYGSFVYYE